MPPDVIDLEKRITALAADGFAGAVRVDVGGTTELRAAYGLADRARTIPVTVDTRLGIASGSKVLTAYTVIANTANGAWPVRRAVMEHLGSRVGQP